MNSIVESDSVYYRYPGQQSLALNGLTVALPAGEKIAVIGGNGSGKSTFFLHCNGLCRPLSGEMRFVGHPIAYDHKSLVRLRRSVGIVFQNADDQLFSASVAQDISFGPLNLGLGEAEARERVRSAAELCEVDGLLERPTHALSGGEKARVALAGVLAMDPDLLIIDELTSVLDPWVRRRVFAIFERLHRQGKTLLLATHDLAVVRQWASYLVVMQSGRAAFVGTPERLLADEPLMRETGLAEVWSSHELF